MTLPQNVIDEDRRLNGQIESSSEALAQLRWHWTLNEDNPDRVPMREYARLVGSTYSSIARYARGYILFRDHAEVATVTEATLRAETHTEREAAIDAVAQSRGQAFTNVHANRRTEVNRVLTAARDRAERYGSTVEEEAPKVAAAVVRAEQADKTTKERRAQRLGLRFIEMEGLLDNAKRTLLRAVQLAHEIEWGDEERELLHGSVTNIQALLKLIDMAFVEGTAVDWDAELARISQGGASS